MVVPSKAGDLDKRIEALSKAPASVDPNDIMEAVESVMTSISGDMSAVNMKLYAELESLARFINTAKAEIAALRPDEIKGEHLAVATDQLEAIVGATEQATNQIFEAVETIEAQAEQMQPEVAEKITEAVTSVYEACGFQDITGQRISKVVAALRHIDQKVEGLLEAFGNEFDGLQQMAKEHQAPPKTGKERPDEHLMNGPQLPGKGQTQDEIDALLGFD